MSNYWNILIFQVIFFYFIVIEKNGRTIHLLKQNAKYFTTKRTRKHNDVAMSLKRFKSNDGKMIDSDSLANSI